MKRERFSFKELTVWQRAVEFSRSVIDVTENIDSDRKHFRLIEQLESASTSVALNIAEGKGRYSKKEFMQFLYIARGSLFEVITLLDIFSLKGWIRDSQLNDLESKADEVNKMICGLINSLKASL